MQLENREYPFSPQIIRLAGKRRTPFLAMDSSRIRAKYRQFKDAMPEAAVFYAVKSNSHRRILSMLRDLGSGFEISSEKELSRLLSLGVSPERIISSNPLKMPAFIQAAHTAGVTRFAFDSVVEADKLAEYAPGSRVYVRLAVSNEGSQWPLSRKFGVETRDAAELLAAAAARSLVPHGVTFHVGSQCTDEVSWAEAIKKARDVWEITKEQGIELKMLNLGGGFPIEYTATIPSVDRVAATIRKTVTDAFPKGVEIFIEPGRALVGEAGTLVSSVIAKAKRNGEDWLYLDVGVFNGLMESIGGIEYSMIPQRDGPRRRWTVAGPSCDSVDVISEEVDLPELEIGDHVYISSAGAYTTAYASEFNGFPIPRTYFF